MIDKALMDMAGRLMEDGKTVCYAEYRLCESAEREFMSAASGKRESYSGVWHTVEFPTKSVQISDGSIPDGFDPEKYVSPYKKGSMVLIEVESKGYQKGKGERWRGVIHLPAEKAVDKVAGKV